MPNEPSSPRRTPTGGVRRLHSVRVLVVSRDRPYLRVTSLLLAQRGFAVETAARLAEVPRLVARHRTNVVVLDVGNAPAAAVRSAAALRARKPPFAVVFVGERQARPELGGARIAPKWEATELLAAEIERSYASIQQETTSEFPLPLEPARVAVYGMPLDPDPGPG